MRRIPEVNVVKKDWRKVDVKIGLCYPNIYRVGMTGLSLRLLYALLNSREDVACERFFMPTKDEPLLSLESNQPMNKFDVIAFTVQYEWDYANLVRMLIKSGIPHKKSDRKRKPIVIAGGPCITENPEPLKEFIDVFIVGEAEPVVDDLIDAVKNLEGGKIEDLSDIKGVYVPECSENVERVWVKDLDSAIHPVSQQIPLVDDNSPYMPIFGPTLCVEVVRGCGRGCRFCLIGFIGRPKRERSLDHLIEIIDEGVKRTPTRKISLIGAGLSDYSKLEELCEYIVSSGFKLSISSLRPEVVSEDLANFLVKGGQKHVSLAPDAATERLRCIISKCIDEELIVNSAKTLLNAGIKRLKLYFIVGLPGETHEDIKAIGFLSRKIADLGYGFKSINLSINPFVPKPHTPFQWAGFVGINYAKNAFKEILKALGGDRRIVFGGMKPEVAFIQAILSLGDSSLSKAIELAALYGGSTSAWKKAFKETKINVQNFIRSKNFEDVLPWEYIRIGLNRTFLIREFEKALAEVPSPPCEVECLKCGVCKNDGDR